MAISNREAIANLRQKIKEQTADSNLSNQFLYSILLEQAKWLIKREIRSGRLYKNLNLFTPLKCVRVVEASIVDECCPIKIPCTIYRTDKKIPDTWQDDYGPVIKYVMSIDDSARFTLISKEEWNNKHNSPYNKYDKGKYAIYSEGYIWFPKHNPRRANIYGYWLEDTSLHSQCDDNSNSCTRFLDTKFNVPDWLEAEMMAKALDQLARITKQLRQDEQINMMEGK